MNLEVGAEAEATEECCSPVCSPQLAQPAQEHLLRGGPTHSELGSPSSIVNMKISPGD